MYGVNEKQFRITFEQAGKMKGVHGDNFLKLLESRLDNLVYRIGFATTRRGARQLVNHGHVTVNGKKVDIPSYRCKPGDVIAIKEAYKEMVESEIFHGRDGRQVRLSAADDVISGKRDTRKERNSRHTRSTHSRRKNT